MTVKELKKQLKNIPEDAKLLAYQPDAGSYVQLKSIRLEDGKSYGRTNEVLVVFYNEPQEETTENLCPNCSVYCEQRFIDGVCR